MKRVVTLGLVLAMAFAGCLQLPEQGDVPDGDIDPSTGGTMTAKETKSDDATLCTSNFGLDNEDRFCATRTITVDGTLAGFPTLDVALETFNGAIAIKEARVGTWGAFVTMKARGESAAAATAKLDAIAFSWAHEDATGHFVEILADHDGEANNVEVSIELALPPTMIYQVVAGTSNGNIDVAKLRANALALSTSNGKITASGEVMQVSFDTSNGDIEADLTPVSSARWTLATSNGNIALQVPEGPKYGYSIEGETSNGEVDYGMRDGDKGECPAGSEYYTPPCTHRSFETRGFSSRDIQVHVTLDTSNGEVSASAK